MRQIQLFILTILAFFSGINMKAEGYEFLVTGEYLYWKAQERDVEFMRTARGSMMNFPGIIPGTDKVHEPTFGWNPGFRVGLKYFPCGCGCFQPGLTYTHYHTKGHKTACGGIPNAQGLFDAVPSLPPTVPPLTVLVYPDGIPRVARGHSTLSLDFDYLDLDLVGDTRCCGCFIWNWDFGLRGALIKSRWNTDYLIQVLTTVPGQIALAPQKVKIDWRYEAAGIKIDAGGTFDIGCGIKFYQDITGALMLGRLRSLAEATISPPNASAVGICDIHNSRYKIVPVIQSETGIDWSCCLPCGYSLHVNVAFEYMKWFNIAENRYYTIPVGSRYKDSCVDLDIYGLTAGFTVVF